MKPHPLLLAFLIAAALPSITFAQKCQVSKDPITGEKIITVNLQHRWVYMKNKGDQTKLSVVKGYLGEPNVAAPAGSEFTLKLDECGR